MEKLDLSILYFFNRDLANPIFDYFFLTIAESKIFLGIILLIVALFIWRGSSRVRLALAVAVICVAIADPLTHYVLKPLFARPRPCHVLDDLRMLVGCGGRFGMPSNHAVNIFTAMTVLSLFIRKYSYGFSLIAVLIGISRIYLGRHYPGDVLAGAAFGIVLAFVIMYILMIIFSRYKNVKTLTKWADDIRGALRWKR